MAQWDGGLPSGGSGYLIRLIAYQASQNIGANTSVVAWVLQIIKGSGSGKWADGPHYWSVNIGGVNYSGSIGSYDFRGYSVLTLASGSTTLGHNADGTLSIWCASWFDDNNTWGELGDGGAAGSLGLTTIPRATTAVWEVAGAAIAGVAKKLLLPRASSGFTHKVEYFFGSASGVIGTNLATEVTWTPPMALLNQIPNAASGNGTIRTTTYNGGTVIGTRDSSFTLNAPASVVPTFDTVTHDEATPGLAAAVGAYVQTLTKLALEITGAAGTYGSTISAYKIEVAGQTLTTRTGTTAAIATSGAVAIKATITDTRGRTATKTVNVTVLAYAAPTLTDITGQRALSTGIPNEEGTYVRANVNASVRSLVVGGTEKNALSYRILSRARGSTVWTLKSTTTPGGVAFDGYGLVSVYAVTTSWEFRVEVVDALGTVSAREFTIATSSVLMDLDGANGLGIGKYREQGMLDVLGQAYQNNGKKVIDEAMAATASARGVIELATQAEVNAGTDGTRAITPATLSGRRRFAHLGKTNGFQAIGAGVYAGFPTTPQVNVGGWTVSANGLVVPADGYYRVGGKVYYSGGSTGATCGAQIRKNLGDLSYFSCWKGNENDVTITLSWLGPLVAGDNIALWINIGPSLWGTNGTNGTYLEIEQIV